MSLEKQLKKMGLDDGQIASATINGKLLSEAKPKKRSDGWPGFRSKWEALYAMELRDEQAAGEILGWDYEPFSMRLTDKTVVDGKTVRSLRYTPDFAVWLPDGRLRLVEVKGYRRDAGITRYKAAKDKFRHIEFVMVTRKAGSWMTIM